MRVDRFDFAVPDLISIRADLSRSMNVLISELETAYDQFCFKRDNGLFDEIEVSEVLVPFTALTEVACFLAQHYILKKHAFDKIVIFIDTVIVNLKEYEELYGGKYV